METVALNVDSRVTDPTTAAVVAKSINLDEPPTSQDNLIAAGWSSSKSSESNTLDALTGLPPEQKDNFVWYGADMKNRSDEWCHQLTETEVAELVAASSAWLAAHPAVELDDIAVDSPQEFPLPTFGAKLVELRDEVQSGRGFTLLRGLPVDSLTERELITIWSGMGVYMGGLRSQDARGSKVGHVRDVGLSTKDPHVRIYQTSERQSFHTDWADVVGLLCIKPAMRGGTSLLVSSSTIFNEMRRRRPDLLAVLMQPIAMDCRGETADGDMPFTSAPVFNYLGGFLTTLYHRQYFNSAQRFPEAPRLTPIQVEALDYFDELANSPELCFSMQLQPGDMQLVYNHTMLHDRTAFEDWPGEAENRRHLLRIWIALPGDRPLPQSFASRFMGSVEVGDRGGVRITKPRAPEKTTTA